MAPVMTQEELEARQDEIRGRLQEIDTEYAGQALPDTVRSEWNDLNEEFEGNGTLITEMRARRDRIAELSQADGSREEGATFQTSRPGVTRGEDIWDLATVRMSADSPESAVREMRDRALRATEGFKFPEIARDQATRDRIAGLVERDQDGSIARHILSKGSPGYHKAFAKALAGRHLTAQEQRDINITTPGDGGYAVPVTLDPTVILVSNWSVNPMRAISRVETITGNTWQGLTSTGIVAGYGAEATEATESGPAFLQPVINVEKAQAFVASSIELEQDWSSLANELARMFSDAKDDLEATKFIKGSGHASNEPQGLVVGATTQYQRTTQTNTFSLSDLYATQAALPPRFRPRAAWVANQSIYQIIRRFSEDESNNSTVLVDTLRGATSADQVPGPGNIGYTVLGKPAYESSAMDSFPTTTITADLDIMVYGDFRHYVIVDRIGMSVEYIPHLFGGVANFPTGQRGFYAYWRNSAEVVAPAAFVTLHVENTS